MMNSQDYSENTCADGSYGIEKGRWFALLIQSFALST